jgi:dienelactone hydrolase
MAEVVVFHHALGLTDRVLSFAASWRDTGHTVHTPDLYDGRTFETIEDGMAFSENIGGPLAIVERARVAVESLSSEVVYVGFSLGVLPAQSLAQTRPGARAAVLCYAALPLGQWATTGPRRGRKVCVCNCTSWTATKISRSRRGSPLPCPKRSSSSIPVPSTISPSTTTKRLGC